MDARAYWFRQYFVGKPYITLIGRDKTLGNNPIIISVAKERVDSKFRYRIISRGKQVFLFIFPFCFIKKTELWGGER